MLASTCVLSLQISLGIPSHRHDFVPLLSNLYRKCELWIFVSVNLEPDQFYLTHLLGPNTMGKGINLFHTRQLRASCIGKSKQHELLYEDSLLLWIISGIDKYVWKNTMPDAICTFQNNTMFVGFQELVVQ